MKGHSAFVRLLSAALVAGLSHAAMGDENKAARAAKLYDGNCASCHQKDGSGTAGSVPSLVGNQAVVTARPSNVIAAVLEGMPARGSIMAMPGFSGSLSDQDITDLSNYVRTSWGNDAAANATPDLVAALRNALALPVYGTEAARAFECPTVGQGAASDMDPGLIATLGAQMERRAVDYATLVDTYKAQHPHADATTIINNMVAAYCPRIAQSGISDEEKSMTLKQFAINISSYVASRSIAETEPDVGIIWATPVGYSLAEHIPGMQSKLVCPPNDGSRVSHDLVEAAQTVQGKVDANIPARQVVSQADAMQAQNTTAKPADIANALILAYCEGVLQLPGETGEKQAALSRYGQQVIEELQRKAEAGKQPRAAAPPSKPD